MAPQGRAASGSLVCTRFEGLIVDLLQILYDNFADTIDQQAPYSPIKTPRVVFLNK
jgi:hypothetical protein